MRVLWSHNEVEYLKAHYADMSTKDIASKLNRSVRKVYQKAAGLGLGKSEAFKRSGLSGRITSQSASAINSRFKKGSAPWNKGTKGSTSANKTSFRKGQQPHNTLFDGAESIRDSKGKPYVWVRCLGEWRLKQRVVWEAIHGAIPKGYNIQFRDKNTLNCAIENLYIIKRKDQMLQNSIHNYPPEIKGVIRTLGHLKRKIKKHEKQD